MTEDKRDRFVWSEEDIKIIRNQGQTQQPSPVQRAAQLLPQLQELIKKRGR